MATYSHYLGATVTVEYRLGDILLSATGNFVGDSGRSIFLEQHLEQRGRRNYFRWEIPYGHIHSIESTSAAAADVTDERPIEPWREQVRAAAAGAIGSARGSASLLPLARPPKTA